VRGVPRLVTLVEAVYSYSIVIELKGIYYYYYYIYFSFCYFFFCWINTKLL